MPTTYEPIATTALGSTTSTITFSSIPQTYTDLRLVLSPTSTTDTYVGMRFNSVSTNSYYTTYLNARGTNDTIYPGVIGPYDAFPLYQDGSSSSTPSLVTVDIFSYTNTAVSKQSLSSGFVDKNGSGNVSLSTFLFAAGTPAITSITLFLTSGGVFSIGTVATLYGIKAA